jgi:RHS repeat-associated protein
MKKDMHNARRDNGGVGTGSLTQATQFRGGAAFHREIRNVYDCQTRSIATNISDKGTETTCEGSFNDSAYSQKSSDHQPESRGIAWPLESRMHVRHRDYSPTLGQFIERDPIGFEAGDNNWYRFVANGPTVKTDLSGLQAVPVPLPSVDLPSPATRPTPIYDFLNKCKRQIADAWKRHQERLAIFKEKFSIAEVMKLVQQDMIRPTPKALTRPEFEKALFASLENAIRVVGEKAAREAGLLPHDNKPPGSCDNRNALGFPMPTYHFRAGADVGKLYDQFRNGKPLSGDGLSAHLDITFPF